MRLGVDHADPRGTSRVRIRDEAVRDGVRTQRHPASRGGRRQRRRVAGEIGAVRTASVTEISRLALPSPIVRLRQDRDAAADQPPILKARGDPVAQVRLDAVHVERGQQLAVRQLRQPRVLAADADELLDMVVPRLDVVVADRPVDADAFLRIRLEIQIAPPEAVPRPQQRTSAHLVAAIPAEVFHRVVGMVHVLHKEVLRVLSEEIQIALDGVILAVLPRRAVAMRQLPWIERRRRVVLDVFDVPSALEDERLQSGLRQFLRGPSSADAGAHDDGVEVGHRVAHAFCPGLRSMQPR